MKNFEQMSSDVRNRRRIFLHNVQIFEGNGPTSRIDSFEKERVEQVALRSHNSVHASFLNAAMNVLNGHDVSI